jgi:hypothetical protein
MAMEMSGIGPYTDFLKNTFSHYHDLSVFSPHNSLI